MPSSTPAPLACPRLRARPRPRYPVCPPSPARTASLLTQPWPPRRLQVNVLTLFVESNQGDEDTTIIQKLALFGSGALLSRAAACRAACCCAPPTDRPPAAAVDGAPRPHRLSSSPLLSMSLCRRRLVQRGSGQGRGRGRNRACTEGEPPPVHPPAPACKAPPSTCRWLAAVRRASHPSTLLSHPRRSRKSRIFPRSSTELQPKKSCTGAALGRARDGSRQLAAPLPGLLASPVCPSPFTGCCIV